MADPLVAIDSTTAEWTIFPVEQINAELDALPLLDDPATGMQMFQMVYKAGFVNPWHTHPCSHGIYVLSGKLQTLDGEHGPGAFVWFPEGLRHWHGATDDADCTFLFVTNKPFDIFYDETPER